MSARAKDRTQSQAVSPARTKVLSTELSTELPPARADKKSPPKEKTPARASTETTSVCPAPARAVVAPPPTLQAPARDELLEQIRLLGRTLDDLKRMRVMSSNRVAAFERELGLTIDYHDVIVKQLRVAEHIAELELKRAWRKHPIAAWAKGVRGVGDGILLPRLIATT